MSDPVVTAKPLLETPPLCPDHEGRPGGLLHRGLTRANVTTAEAQSERVPALGLLLTTALLPTAVQ